MELAVRDSSDDGDSLDDGNASDGSSLRDGTSSSEADDGNGDRGVRENSVTSDSCSLVDMVVVSTELGGGETEVLVSESVASSTIGDEVGSARKMFRLSIIIDSVLNSMVEGGVITSGNADNDIRDGMLVNIEDPIDVSVLVAIFSPA